ncbi:peptide-methionine (S)-S-oxide reductase MsrA [Candidatus Wolfebacteria bacterium]|nr:peptide-methionine (S)-S-oxide reductase MsrA [Candidatus Wolfebacteria bacterium]
MAEKNEIAVFGGGCFWCTEAVFKGLKGVVSVVPGYAGGGKTNPIYEEVLSGKTGHAEVIKLEYDPIQIFYQDLLTVFFATHDPTTLNRQGNDVGTQYRSIIFYTTPEQEKEAKQFIEELSQPGKRVVTELKPLEKFYEAENYHRNYYQKNSNAPYCQVVISPKLDKLKEKFYNLLNNSKESTS